MSVELKTLKGTLYTVKMHKLFVLTLVAALQLCLGLPANLQENSAQNIEKLLHLSPNELAEELSGQIEGDIVMTTQQITEFEDPTTKAGLIDERYSWPDSIVYYELTPRAFSQAQVDYIELGLRLLELRTCLRFLPRQPEHKDYILVTGENTGCWSFVGRVSGVQELNLQLNNPGAGCFRIGTIMHEFIHAIGFYHMQSATDRDTYVKIVWENIQSGTESNFNTYPATRISTFGVDYDYESVMHYGATAFSINGEATIIPIFDPEAYLGQRTHLTNKDIARINNKYCS